MLAFEASKHLLSRINVERFETIGDGISPLKIQKMLFYLQKTSYSVYNKPFFDDTIEAWQYGPVIQSIYHQYKIFGNENINIVDLHDSINDKQSLDQDELLIMDFVWDKYNKYTATKLVDLTHNDKAWKNNFIDRLNNPIPKEDFMDDNTKQDFLAYENELMIISSIEI